VFVRVSTKYVTDVAFAATPIGRVDIYEPVAPVRENCRLVGSLLVNVTVIALAVFGEKVRVPELGLALLRAPVTAPLISPNTVT